MITISKRLIVTGVTGVLVGAATILGIRFVTYQPPEETHYHANMAVYINGQREEFKAVDYYEETAATFCSINESASENKPMTRTHMHGNVNDVVHVEDKLVTWGNFFTVLGWNVGPQYVATRDAIYQSNETSKVTYMLNGKKVDDIANRVIGDQDKLLVSYGDQSTSDIQSEYDKIKNNAKEANESDDPASCGSHHEDDTSLSARLKHLF